MNNSKSLLALAIVAGFASAASAQSSVTIYGSLDMAITKGNGGTAFNQGANGTSEAWQLKQSNGSRLGFRGNEDLGGGLAAQFDIQHRFTPDDGAANAIFWAGRSIVSLSSKDLGRVYLGRDYTPAYYIATKSDPFGQDGVAQMGGRQFAGFSAQVPGTAGAPSASSPASRTANTVGYVTPSFSGLTVQAAVGLGEGTIGREAGINAEYAAGPVYAGVGYEKITGGAVSGAGLSANGDGSSLVNLALHYNFGVVKPIFYYARSKMGVGNNSTHKFIQLGATAPIAAGKLKVAYGRFDPQGDNNTENKLGLGYDYSLSKRTTVYADVGFGKQDERTNNTAYALGLKHTF